MYALTDGQIETLRTYLDEGSKDPLENEVEIRVSTFVRPDLFPAKQKQPLKRASSTNISLCPRC